MVSAIRPTMMSVQPPKKPAAVPDLGKAVRLWRDLEFPYETARVRVALGRARLLAGDDDLARIDLDAARATFDRLGAVPDLRATEAILRSFGRPDGDRERVTDLTVATMRSAAELRVPLEVNVAYGDSWASAKS